MATQRFYDGQPGPDIRRELNNFEAILDGTVASAQAASTAATSASVKAQQWADAAPGVAVEPGKYSAKHWADRAQTTVTGGLIYRGSHSAASGTYPATPSLGDYYKISAAGTLGGVAYSVGDSIIYNGTDWDKIDSTDAVTSVAGRVGEVVLTKGDVGLGNVDNTSDANKPVSTATQTALDTKVDKVAGKQLSTEDYTTAEKSKLSGVAAGANNYSHPEGDGNQHVPATGTTNNSKVLKAGSTAGSAAWGDVDYSEVTGLQSALDGKEGSIAAGTTEQYWRGDKTWRDFFTDVRAATLTGLSTATNAVITATDTVLSALGKLQKQVSDNLATLTIHTGNTSNPHGVTKAQVGLGNVDNTSDANKPVSTATQTALNAKAPVSHTHDASAIVSGTIADDRLPVRLREVAASITDWNDAQANGWYMASNAANAPVPNTWFIGSVENHGAAGWCVQLVHAFSTDSEYDTRTYRRERNNGAWSTWQRCRITEAEQVAVTQAWWGSTAIPISKVTGLQSALDAKANSSQLEDFVRKSGAETIAGAKTFSDSLRVGSLADLIGAPFIGNPRVYHQTNAKLDQLVFVKSMTGPVASTDLGRTAQVTAIQTYDAVLDTNLNAVNVASSVLNVTNNVGSVAAARGSAIGQQNVVTVGDTNTTAGPNEYANVVQLLDPTIGKTNAGNTFWQNDYTSNGPKDGAEYSLFGTVQAIHKYNAGAPTSGQATIGALVTTRPAGGAGSQDRTGLYTFPIDIGIGVAGFSGVNNTALLPGGHHSAATEGFKIGIKVGGKQGPWLNEPGKYTGGSKIGTGLSVEDHTVAAVAIDAPHPSAPAALAITTAYNAGDVALGGGDWNTSHLRLGTTHVWVDTSGNLRKKAGAPAATDDGAIVGGVAGNVAATGVAVKLPSGWTVSKASTGTYVLSTDFPLNADNYGISATCRDSAPGWVRRAWPNGTGFVVETVDGGGQLADRAFGFTAIQI